MVSMRSHRIFGILLAFAAVTGLSRLAGAENFRVKPLTEKSLARINQEARVHYDKSVYLADRILFREALDEAQKAIAADPGSVALRYFAIRFSDYLAKTTFGPSLINDNVNHGVDASKYYDVAIENLDAILQMPKITNRQRARTAYDLQRVKKKRDEVAERDNKRRELGRKVAVKYARQVYKDTYREKFKKKFEEAVEAITTAGEADEAAKAAAEALSESESKE